MIESGICGDCGKYFKGGCCVDCRQINSGNSLNFIPDFHEYYFDYGLGELVKSRQHRKQLMKEKKVEEVGNEWKYIDPVRNRESIEKEAEREFEEAKKDAMQIMGRHIWN